MRRMLGAILASTLVAAAPAQAQEVGWVAGEVIDQNLAITLPGVPVEAVGTGQVAYTDLDGRYRLELPPGTYDIRIVLAGYAETNVGVAVVAGQLSAVRIALGSNVFAEELVVTAPTLEADSSTAAAQMMMRMRAPSVQDNIGAIEMSANNDSNAADAMQRVTGVSVVEGQSVFVRGLGERYSNTTLAGATLPTTEPDRRVVPLDLFPTGLIDSVQVSKTYTPDKPSQFAGGLVEIVPMKLPDATSFELSAGGGWNSLTTGAMGLGYAGGGRDWLGFDDGTRALPTGFPDRKVTRGGRFSGTLGFSGDDLERMGEQFANVWDPQPLSLPIDQSYNALFGGRFGKLGIVATLRHAQGSQFTEEQRTFYKVGSGGIERSTDPTTSRPPSSRAPSARSATSPTSSRRTSGCRSTTSTRTSGPTRPAGSRATTTTPATTSGTSGCGGSRNGSPATTWAATTSSRPCRTAGWTGRSPCRAPTARSRICARSSTSPTRRARRSFSPTSRRAVCGSSTI